MSVNMNCKVAEGVVSTPKGDIKPKEASVKAPVVQLHRYTIGSNSSEGLYLEDMIGSFATRHPNEYVEIIVAAPKAVVFVMDDIKFKGKLVITAKEIVMCKGVSINTTGHTVCAANKIFGQDRISPGKAKFITN
jgi:hypothetical protein